jgi:hypothetical protein
MDKKERVNRIIDLVNRCPDWTTIGDDEQRRHQLMTTLDDVSKNDIDDLRSVMAHYQRCPEDNEAAVSTLFLLNRYLFAVPEIAPISSPCFGGWLGVPHDSTHVNLLWPFSFDTNGHLVLSASYRGYNGRPYRALDEFNYFQKAFGLRKRAG